MWPFLVYAAAHSSLVRYFHQRLPTTYEPVAENRKSSSDVSQAVCAANDRDGRSNWDSLEK